MDHEILSCYIRGRFEPGGGSPLYVPSFRKETYDENGCIDDNDAHSLRKHASSVVSISLLGWRPSLLGFPFEYILDLA